MLPVVAIVGRPNVGKSSLFNRLVGRRRAIESDVSGTTRDQISQRVRLMDHEALIIDTGGLELESEGNLEENVQSQAQEAIRGADVVVFVVDGTQDLTSVDFHAAEILRKSGKPCVMVANKCDNLSLLEEKTYNFYELGFGEPVAASAVHGTGLDALRSAIEVHLKALGALPIDEEAETVHRFEGLRLTFVGRPNVGKSSMVNALFGKEKVIVSEIPGTTRDAVEVPFSYNEKPFVLVDTAGMRKRGKIEKGIEKYSVMRSFQSIDDSDVVVLMMDGDEGLFAQDLHVCEFVLSQNKGLIIVVNKIDLFDDPDSSREYFTNKLRRRMAFVPWAPVIFTSALKRKNIFAILDVALEIGKERERTIGNEDLNQWIQDAVFKHPAAGGQGKRRAKVIAVEQKGINPPTFILNTKFPDLMHFSYQRYLENSLRERFGFTGTGIKMIYGREDGPTIARRPDVKKGKKRPIDKA